MSAKVAKVALEIAAKSIGKQRSIFLHMRGICATYARAILGSYCVNFLGARRPRTAQCANGQPQGAVAHSIELEDWELPEHTLGYFQKALTFAQPFPWSTTHSEVSLPPKSSSLSVPASCWWRTHWSQGTWEGG